VAEIFVAPVKGSLALSGLGLPSVVGLLLVIEAGVPVPVPADLLMLLVGERASAGAISPWGAMLLLEVIALFGTSVLFSPFADRPLQCCPGSDQGSD
jgi:membrane protein DedA with SNARE-associated domain